jgi:hypothetical protein
MAATFQLMVAVEHNRRPMSKKGSEAGAESFSASAEGMRTICKSRPCQSSVYIMVHV